jgi:hypothetical protein
MKKLHETKAIWHALVWVFIYIVLVNVGDLISENLGIANSATSILLILLSAGLLLYVTKNQWTGYYGLRWPHQNDLQKVWFYIPLVIIAGLQYAKGINSELGLRDIALVIVLMIGVGFIEELLFRGFLYQGILKNGSLTRAILISGVTFGLGHIVNLMRGYSIADQGLQIVMGVTLGIALALLVAVTDSLLPGVVFHTLLNISGNLTNSNQTMEMYVVIIAIVICVIYCMYLKKWLPRQKAGQALA